jgi:hypothetical protein
VNSVVPAAPIQTPATNAQDGDQALALPMHDDEDVLAEEPAGPIEPVAADLPGEPIRRVHPVRNRQPWKATVGMAHDSHPDKLALIQEASASPAAEFWQQAMTEELQSLHSNAT